jgi:hypothetical protein
MGKMVNVILYDFSPLIRKKFIRKEEEKVEFSLEK